MARPTSPDPAAPGGGRPIARRASQALVVSFALCILLASRVYIEFHGARFKIVTTPMAATAGRVQVDAAGASGPGKLQTPFALIARIRSEATGAFSLAVDGRNICRPTIRAGGSRRVDCAITGSWEPSPHAIVITGPAGPWSLDYLELATHHGATQAYDLVIVPVGSRDFTRPGAALILFAFAAIVLLLLLPAPPRIPHAVLWLHRTLAAPIVVFFALVFCSAFVSPYLVLLSLQTFVRGVAILAARRLWVAGSWLVRRWRQVPPWVVAAIVAVLVAGAYGRLVHEELRTRYHGNVSGFISLSWTRFDADPILRDRKDIRRTLAFSGPRGYDAQFVYLEAYDPLLRAFRQTPSIYNQFIDAPPYRYGRIGFALLTRICSAGRWQLFPATMMALILASLFAAGLTLSTIATLAGTSPWWGLLIAIVPGFWQSVQKTLPEPIAAALLLGGCLCWFGRRYVCAGALLACSLLVRETGAVVVVALAVTLATGGQRRDAVRVAAVALLPLIVWRLYVGWVLWPTWGIHGILYSPGDLTVPFTGFGTLWRRIAEARYYPDTPSIARSGVSYPMLLTAGLVLAIASALLQPGPLSLAAVVYGLVAVSLNYGKIWVHVENGQRGTYELFLMLALLSPGMSRYPRLFRAAVALFWAGAATYVFFIGFDAETIARAVLWPVF